MDNSLERQGSETQQPPNPRLVSSLLFLDRIEKWLAGFFQMTQAEQEEAGIYIEEDRDDK